MRVSDALVDTKLMKLARAAQERGMAAADGLNEIAMLVVVTLAGFMRGVTGFGGAMLMAPPLSLLIGRRADRSYHARFWKRPRRW